MPDFFLDASPQEISTFKQKSKEVKEASGTGGIAKVFHAIEKQINPELVKKVQGVYMFQVSGSYHTMNTKKPLLFLFDLACHFL